MKLYELISPNYRSDHEYFTENPFETDENYLPGLYCYHCDETWGSSNRIFTNKEVESEITAFIIKQKLQAPMNINEWRR